jgi:hypothetical protein
MTGRLKINHILKLNTHSPTYCARTICEEERFAASSPMGKSDLHHASFFASHQLSILKPNKAMQQVSPLLEGGIKSFHTLQRENSAMPTSQCHTLPMEHPAVHAYHIAKQSLFGRVTVRSV